MPGPVAAPRGGHVPAPRTPFVLLVLALLGGGLVCLVVINTTLGASSFRISQLQQSNTTLAQQEQALQREVSASEAPAQLEQRAYQLGMRPVTQPRYLDLGKGVRSKHRSRPSAGSGHRKVSRTRAGSAR